MAKIRADHASNVSDVVTETRIRRAMTHFVLGIIEGPVDVD